MQRPTAAVVAFSRQQIPSEEILVEVYVAGEGGGGEVVLSPTFAEACGITGHICTTNSAEPDTADSAQGDD